VDQVCNYFGYTRQAFYKHRMHNETKLAEEQQILAAVIEIRNRQPMIGARKIQQLLRKRRNKLGICIGRDRLFTLLRENNLLISPKKKYVKTTNSYHRFRMYNNLIKELDITKPDQVYVSDITYITIIDGFCYLSLITDLFSRKIVGYCLSQSLGIDGCLTALKMALTGIAHPENLIHHSDRGIQYCSQAYVELLTKNNIKISMTEQNHVYENAVAERINGILKTEFLLGETLTSFEIAQQLVAEAIQTYNKERPHMNLNYQTPDEVYYANNYQPIAKISTSAVESNKLNLNYRSNVDNSEVINTESTSYPQQSKGFQHISEYLNLLKLNKFQIISS
jgi:putative transposase